MTTEDICATLTEQNMLIAREGSPPPISPRPGQVIKFPKGRKNGISRRQLSRMSSFKEKDDKGPFMLPKHYEIQFDRAKVAAWMRSYESKGQLKLKPEKLQWTPYLLSRGNKEFITDTPGLGMVMNGTAAVEEPSPQKTEGDLRPTLNLFSSPSLDEQPQQEDAEGDELPQVETRASRRSIRKSPSKLKRGDASPLVESANPLTPVSVSRRTRRTNGAEAEPSTVQQSRTRTRRNETRAREEAMDVPEEDVSTSARKLRSTRGMAGQKPGGFDEGRALSARKRRKVATSEPEDDEVGEAEKEEALVPREEAPQSEEAADKPSPPPPPLLINGGHETLAEVEVLSEIKSEEGGGDAVRAESPATADAVGTEDDGTSAAPTSSPPFEEPVAQKLGPAESDLRSTLESVIPDDELGDEDADGEYEDEDAEGECYYSWA